jgi:hypothetical protein
MAQQHPDKDALPELVLHAARDIAKVDTALDADILLSTLLGSVYAGTLPDRGAALDSFIEALTEHLATVRSPTARLVEAVLTGTPAEEPAWGRALGTVRPTGAYAYGDRYGDQTGYLAVFDYPDEEHGGPEHALVFLVDHNLGLVKDIVVVAPASAILDQLRAETDPMSWFTAIEPSTIGTAASAYLRAADLAAELPEAESLAANRGLARSRLALLPAAEPSAEPAPVADRGALIEGFLAAPESRLAGLADAAGARREAVTYALGLIVDFAGARGGDPLRWSPRAVDLFLLDWVHQRALLDAADIATLPDVLGAWVFWAGRRVGLPENALQETFEQVTTVRGEFERLCATGERQSLAAKALAQLIAEGVDLTDTAAVDAWLKTYNAGAANED